MASRRGTGVPHDALRAARHMTAGGCCVAAAFAVLALSPGWGQTDVTPSVIRTMPTAPAQSPFDLSGPSRAQRGAATEGIAPEGQFDAGLDLAAVYASNAQGGPVSQADEYLRGQLNLAYQYMGPRLTASAAYALTGLYHARFNHLNRIENRLNLTADGEAYPETLFVHARAFAEPLQLTRVGSISPGGGSISDLNSRDTYGYSVGPELRFDLSDFASSTTSATQGGVFFVRPTTGNPGVAPPVALPQNTQSIDVSEKIASGPAFTQMQWTIVGSYDEQSQKAQTDRQYGGALSINYALTRWLAVVGTGGYSNFKATVPLTRDLNGPIGLGGVRLTYGTTFSLTVEGGIQHNFTSYLGSLQWAWSPLTQLMGFATDSVTTPQSSLLSNLTTLAAIPGGGFSSGWSQYGATSSGWSDFGATSGEPLTSGSDIVSLVPTNGLPLDNAIYRDRSGGLTLSHTLERTTLSLSGFATVRDQLSKLPIEPTTRTSMFGGRLAAIRQMWPDLQGTAEVSYTFANEFGGHDRILSAQLGALYHMSDYIDLFGTANYIRRDGRNLIGVPNAALSDIVLMIGVKARI
ncbi:MAG: hypothetical protein KGJ78_02240 [Alphaproteobacteria bacterium]|nr:hypothetical protein [Alphaproteobacteria bacterium]